MSTGNTTPAGSRHPVDSDGEAALLRPAHNPTEAKAPDLGELRARVAVLERALLEIAGSADGQVMFVVSSAHRKAIEIARSALTPQAKGEGNG